MMKKETFQNRIAKVFGWMFSLMVLLVIANDIVFSRISYVAKKEFVLPAAVLFALAGAFLFFVKKELGRMQGVAERFPVRIAVVLLFLYQVFVGYEILFLSHIWDVGTVMDNVYAGASGNLWEMDSDYFSHFPNNQGIFLVEYIVFKVLALCGLLTLKRGLFLMVVLQCLCSALTSLVLYRLLEKHTGKTGAFLGWALYAVTIGLSGWQVVVYTDMLALLFPILVLYLYDGRRDRMAWVLIFVLSYVGYLIKPTALIAFLGIAVTEAVRLVEVVLGGNEAAERDGLGKLAGRFRQTIVTLLISFATVFAVGVCFRALVNATPLVLDKEKNTGALHMLMMGLNNENDGAIVMMDVAYSISFETREERTAAQLAKIKERLSSYSATDFAKFMIKKALVDFNDGTYAWGEEADFYGEQYTSGALSDFYKSLYYKTGRLYFLKQYAFQVLWYAVLLLCAMTALVSSGKTILPFVLSLMGMMVFDMLFEARARYLIIYAPVFLFVAVRNELSITKN